MATGAVAAAAGSVASQMFGMAIGAQQDFSWSAVGMSAFSGGIGAGLSGVNFTGGALNSVGNSIVRSAIGNAMTQGIGVVTGLQEHFDWRGVAASAVASGVGAGINDSIMGAEQMGPSMPGSSLPRIGGMVQAMGGGNAAQLFGATLKGFATELTAVAMRGGRVSVMQVATDAFGNALADSIVGQMGRAGTQEAQLDQALTAGDFARMDGANYRSVPYEAPWTGGQDWASDVGARAAANPRYTGVDDRNGMDVASDNYNGSRRTVTVGANQGPLAALAAAGLNKAQQQAGYGYLLQSGQVQIDRNGVPMVQPGQQLHIDLDDTSQSALAARTIGRESAMRADRLTASAQAATAVNAGAYPNMDARDLRNTFGYQSMMSRELSDLGSVPSANYAEARASTLSARETAVDWVRSVVGTDRAGNVIAGAANGWLAGGEAVLKLPDAIASIPSAVSRLASGTASAATQLWNDPVGSVTNAMASGVDGFRTGFNQTVNGNGFAMGSALYALGTAGLPLGRAEEALGTVGVPVTRSANPLSSVLEFDAHGNEIMYRSMSREDFKYLDRTGMLRPTTETSMSPDFAYSSKYTKNDSVTVRFATEPGTSAALQEIGIAANLPAELELGMAQRSGKWMQTNTRFKVEGGQMTTQLGQGPGIKIFNQGIVDFERVR